jgi:glyoxylate/hydroxypyruvate reductase A
LQILFYSPDSESVDDWIELLAAEGISFDPVRWAPGNPPSGAEVVITRFPEDEMFRSETNLKIVFNMTAGVDGVLRMESLPIDVPIIRLEDSGMAKKMAEYAIYAIAEISRDMDKYRQAKKDKKWLPEPRSDVEDWPVGVMGLGIIGREVATQVARIGYPVSGWARSRHALEAVSCYAGEAGFNDFLSHTRILINVLPVTPQTENIMNKQTFDRLLPDGYIINMGRGQHLDENALTESIASGVLGGAVLDVFRTEPLPASHPFWTNPAISITPHVSGKTDMKAAIKQVARKFRAWQVGEKLSGMVDRSVGY